jgi:hypothetical protein
LQPSKPFDWLLFNFFDEFFLITDGSDEHICPYVFSFEDCTEQTGEELCLWQNEAPDKLIWKVISSRKTLFFVLNLTIGFI